MNNNFEEYISNYLNTFKTNEISEAMKYCMDGGKRIRPLITFSILKGFKIDETKGYAASLALEMIQTYSLIHDDLPEMDNDDFRRGKPSCHKKYGVGNALLCGDALLTHSFGVISSSDYSSETKAKMITCLSKYAGMDGMIYGQLLDTKIIEKNEKNLYLIEDNKTGGLFKIACLFAMYIANIDNEDYFIELGSKIGVIFQLQDDLIDATRSEEEIGKSLSDKENDKFTALSIYGIEELKMLIENKFKELYVFLNNAPFEADELTQLINRIAKR